VNGQTVRQGEHVYCLTRLHTWDERLLLVVDNCYFSPHSRPHNDSYHYQFVADRLPANNPHSLKVVERHVVQRVIYDSLLVFHGSMCALLQCAELLAHTREFYTGARLLIVASSPDSLSLNHLKFGRNIAESLLIKNSVSD